MENHHHCKKCGDMIAPNRDFCIKHLESRETTTSLVSSDYESFVLWKRNQKKNRVLCPDCLGKGCVNCKKTGLIYDPPIKQKEQKP